jgi:4-amino-4-deoxy-L-arabinose transferase-like glycosyltransferase
MLFDLLKGLNVLHGVILVVVAIGLFWFWARTRFWLPRYVHVLAIIALALGIWMLANVSDDAPISKQGPYAKILLVLVLPAMVYFFFVFYGGQHAAYRNRSTPLCPHCRQPVPVRRGSKSNRPDRESSSFRQQCPHCGKDFG